MEKQLGETRVLTEVFEKIARESTLKVDGVDGIIESGGFLGDLMGKSRRKGAVATEVPETAPGRIFDIHLTLRHGVVIPQTAVKVQEAVKEAVERMTQEQVAAVNIHVDGIAPPPGPARQKPKTRQPRDEAEHEDHGEH